LKIFYKFGRWREKIDDHFEKARCEGESASGFFYLLFYDPLTVRAEDIEGRKRRKSGQGCPRSQ